MRLLRYCVSVCAALCAFQDLAAAASTAFRLVDLDLKDPHVFVNLLGCHDITDAAFGGLSVNGDLQTRIQTDADDDGLLDLSLLAIFDPLQPSLPAGPMRFGGSSCSAPLAGTTCGPNPYENLLQLTASNSGSGTCLALIPGTTHGYSSIATPSGPCFASDVTTFTLPLLGGAAPVTMSDVRVAATYSGGPPATSLVNGLLLGFLSQSDADATIIASSYPLVGGQRLSSLLPGGTGCCAAWSDLDTGPEGQPGWWMYFNFVAQAVPYTGWSVDVERDRGADLALVVQSPASAGSSLTYGLAADGLAELAVYDLSGRRVAQLVNGWQFAGHHAATWDGRLRDGAAAGPGVYVVRLASANRTLSRKLVLRR